MTTGAAGRTRRARAPSAPATLAIDVGGTGLKAALLDARGAVTAGKVRIPTPYPCPPPVLVAALQQLRSELGAFDRVSVGFPGMVRRGRVLEVPALSRASHDGPIRQDLAAAWSGFDLATALQAALGSPTRVANDADVQGCGVVNGEGLEFVMTLGTGCGTALFYDGGLLPHMELSHLPFRKRQTFDERLGEAARRRVGNRAWRRRVLGAIDAFDAALLFDRAYVGGGNAKHLRAADLSADGSAKVTIVPNIAGVLGGLKLWAAGSGA